MDQRTKEWLEWRRGGIGSSDAPIIMGVSPWKTPYQLWEEKTGRVCNDRLQGNFATERGNRLEPIARARYELKNGVSMPPKTYQNAEFPFLRASMDGANDEIQKGLEIKCPGKADHATAMAGKVPAKYLPQLMHQLIVTGYKAIDYFSYDGEASDATVPVVPDLDYMALLIKKELEFYDFMVNDEAPPLMEQDYVKIRSTSFKLLANQFKIVSEDYDKIEKKYKDLKKEILLAIEHPRAMGYGVRIRRSMRKGNVDYAKIPELKGVDLEKFRKNFTKTETVEVYNE